MVRKNEYRQKKIFQKSSERELGAWEKEKGGEEKEYSSSGIQKF